MSPRRANILRDACTFTAAAETDWLRITRNVSPCEDAPPRTTVPLTLPADTPEELTALRIPDPVVLANADYRLACAQVENAGPVGEDVVILAGQESRTFHWTTIPDISDSQLHRLAGVELADILRGTPAESDFQGLLESYQIAYLLEAVTLLKAEIAQAVQTAAVAALDCYWTNITTQISCPDDRAATTGQYENADGVNNPSVVLAGAVQSRLSQTDANSQAASLARRALGCLFANDEVLLTCLDLGFQEVVPTDDEPVRGRRRIGSFVVPAGTTLAASKEEANQQAQALAAAALDCYYVNEQMEVSCEEVPGYAGSYSGNPTSLASGQLGNPVSVQAGLVISDGAGASTAAANESARAQARALLECSFRNTRQEVVCHSIEVDGVMLVPRNSTPLVVPAGTYEAASQEEADALARALGLLQLQCEFCNPYIPPVCVLPGVTVPAGSTVPPALIDNKWSVDVTTGLAAGVVCSSDPYQVMPTALAAARARVPVKDAGCTYLNDTMWFGCLDALPGSPTLPPGGYHHPLYPANTTLPPGYTEFPPLVEQLSPYCLPDPTADQPWQVLEAGSYRISDNDVPPGADPKTYVNEKARLYGLALLDCKFANPQMNVTCQSAYGVDKFDQSQIAQGSGQLIDVLVPRASYESVVSFRDAVERAVAQAKTQLDCYYENDELRVSCWEDYGPLENPALVSEINQVRYFGTGNVRRAWVQGGVLYTDVVALKNYHLGSLALPLVVVRGSYRSLLGKEDANALALRAAVTALECTSLARDITECNDSMVVRCGGVVEPNPTSPLQAGTNTKVEDAWSVDDKGVVQAGDGNNYVMSQDGEGKWVPTNLGPSTDPIGGIVNNIKGPGVYIPACSFRGATVEEANTMAYMIGRALLTCASATNIPELGDGGGGLGGGGSDGAQTNCQAECIAVYA